MHRPSQPLKPAGPPRPRRHHAIALLALTINLAPAAIAGTTTDCGNEGLRTCKAGDFEFWNQYQIPLPCEIDLKPEDGYCRNQVRRRLAKDRSWTGWALDEQRSRIGVDEPINAITTLGSHNANSNLAQGMTNTFALNQQFSITDQLQWGMRYLEVDPHFYKGAARLCHASNTFLCLQSGWADGRLFAQLIRELANWLDANPSEVLIVKLDDHLNDLDTGDHSSHILDPIQTYLGSKVYRGPSAGTMSVWPSIAQLRAQGKKIIFISRNSTIGDGTWILPPSYFPTADHPKDANLDTCADAEGVDNASRRYHRYTLLSEGRSMSNLADSTGLLDAASIRKAVACGFSELTLDFVNSLTVPVWGYSDTNPDTRREASIWSWAAGDRGIAGPAMLRASDNRWGGRPLGEVHRFACAYSIRTTAGSFAVQQNRQWKITRASNSWGVVNGDDACKAEFPGWQFAFPANGYQNARLAEVLAASGSSDGVWIKYNSANYQPPAEPSAGPSELIFVISPGDTVMPSQQVLVSGIPGATITTQVTMRTQAGTNWLNAALPGGTAILTADPFPLTISIGPGARQLPVNFNDYLGEVRIGYPGSNFGYGQLIRVRLQVRTASTTQLLLDPPIPVENQPFRISAKVTSVSASLPVQGRITPYDVTPPASPDQPVVPVPFETREFCGSAGNTQTIPAVTLTRPAGKYVFSITYEDAGNCSQYSLRSSETGPVEVNVLPRLATVPATIQFLIQKGATAAKQPFTVAGMNGSGKFTIVEGADTFSVENAGEAAGLVGLTAAARDKLAGIYTGRIEIADSQGTSSLPLRLTVTVPLAGPGSVNLFAATEAVFQNILVQSKDPVPYTLTGDAAWLVLPPGSLQTNQPVQIGANPAGLSPGLYRANVTAASPLSQTTVGFTVFLEVIKPAVITSEPSGIRLSIDGQEVTTPASFAWKPNSLHTVSAPAHLTGPSASTRFRFGAWSDSGAPSHSVTAGRNGSAWKVSYRRQHLVTLSAAPNGAGSASVQPLAEENWYDEQTPVTFTATPAAGFAFLNWSGTSSGNASPLTHVVTAPVTLTANFNRSSVKLTVQSNVPGGAITLDGLDYALPAAIPLEAGKTYKLGAVSPVPAGQGTRLVFASWSNGGALAHDFTAPHTDTALTVNYRTEYLVTTLVSPANSGSVTGGGWYALHAKVALTAAPAAGFAFSNFSGAASSKSNPLALEVTAGQTYVANFTSTSQPSLYATVGAGRADGPQAGQRTITLRLANAGQGGATDAAVFDITNITVIDGSGAVSVVTPLPVSFGTLPAGRSADAPIVVSWPATAARVRFNFRFTANGGTYTGATALTLSR